MRGSAASAGWHTGQFGVGVYSHRKLLRAGVLVAAGLVLLFWTRPTVGVILVTAIVVVVLLAVIEFLAEPPADGGLLEDGAPDRGTDTDRVDTLPLPASAVPSPREGSEQVAPEPVTTGSARTSSESGSD